MQKKVMAVAVATALAAPAAVLAQGSSVQIYGAISIAIEGAQAKGADTNGAPGQTLPGSTQFGAAVGGSTFRGGNTGGGYVAIGSTTPGVNEPLRSRTQAAGSNFGLRGREDLGNGLYMGFQAEAAIQLGGITPASGPSSGTFASWRNSGLWLGGRWGEVGLGIWDSPFNMNQTTGAGHAAYANASTTFAAGLLGGGLASAAGTISAQDVGQWCGQNFSAQSAGNCIQWAASFHRRVGNSIWYQSPTWAGFRGRVQYGATGGATSNATNDSANFPSQVKPSLWGVGVSYTLGGLFAGVGWELHNDYFTSAVRNMGTNAAITNAAGTRCATGSAAAVQAFDLGGNPLAAAGQSATIGCIPVGSATANGIRDDDSTAWNVNLRYTFPFGLSIGGYYEWVRWRMNYGNNPGTSVATGIGNVERVSRNAWRLDAAYQLGAHTFGLQYARGDDFSGTLQGASFNGDNTAVNGWILGYAYSLSKRSSVFAYGTWINNETNARFNGIVFNGIGPNAGGDPRYIGVGLRHLF
jgi:predicted porin